MAFYSASWILKYALSCAVIARIAATNSFNYEVGPRVFENLQYLLQEVSLAMSMPSLQFQSQILNVSDFNVYDVYAPGSAMFYVMKQLYMGKINTLNFGLENGFYYCMINHADAGFPLDIELDVNNPVDPSLINVYHMLGNGQPDFSYNNCSADPVICPFPFDVTHRPWYLQGKKSTSASWTAPFLQTFPLVPTVAISFPLFRPDGDFAGVISANVLLNQISSFLEVSYNTSDRSVFVVDRVTGYLIGSSMGDALYTGTAAEGNLAMIDATQSPNPIISGATLKLNASGWPDYLVIFDDYYLQSVPYEDAIPGVFWTIVVLMPAEQQQAFLPPSSPLFKMVIAIAVLSCLIALLGLYFMIYYRTTKLLKLTCPRLTRLVLFACILLSISAALMAGPNTDELCSARPWFLNLSFTLGLSPLLAKSYMIHYMFNVDPMQKNKIISLKWVSRFTFALMSVDALLISIFGYGSSKGIKSEVVTELLQNGAYGQLTVCTFTSNQSFIIAEVVFKGLMLLSACYLCWQVRRVSDVLAGRWGLILTVYTTTIVCVILLVVLTAVSSVPVRVAIISVGICFCAVVTAASMTLPNLYQLWTYGDEEAVHDVLVDVQQAVSGDDLGRRRSRSTSNSPQPAGISWGSRSWSKSFEDAFRSATRKKGLVLPTVDESPQVRNAAPGPNTLTDQQQSGKGSAAKYSGKSATGATGLNGSGSNSGKAPTTPNNGGNNGGDAFNNNHLYENNGQPLFKGADPDSWKFQRLSDDVVNNPTESRPKWQSDESSSMQPMSQVRSNAADYNHSNVPEFNPSARMVLESANSHPSDNSRGHGREYLESGAYTLGPHSEHVEMV